MVRRPRTGPRVLALLLLLGVVGAACSTDEDAAPDTTTVAPAPEGDDHAHEETTAVPFGESLTVATVTEPVEALVDDLAPFVVHDRHRTGVAFSGAANPENVFFAGIVEGQPSVFDATPQFAAIGSVTVVPQFAALCVDSVYGVVDGAGNRYMARIDVQARRELAATPLPDGGGPVTCGGSVTVVAGAGLRTLGIDSAHGHQFWELPHELIGQPAVAGALTVVPTDAGVLGIGTRRGEELWRQDGSLVERPIAGAPGVWLEFSDEFRLLSPAGDVTATFDREELLADVAAATESGADDVRFELAGSAGAPVVMVIGTDLLTTPDRELQLIASEPDATVELLGPSEGLMWVLRRVPALTSATVELVDVEGEVVATADVDATFVPYVATDQFVVGRASSGLVFVRRD